MEIKMKLRILIFVLFIINVLFFPALLSAQKTGAISGKIIDKYSQAQLAFVTVTVKGSAITTVSDSLGNFRLNDLPVNSYNINFSIVGYNPFTLFNVIVVSGNEKNFTIEMEQATETLQEVSVTGNRKTARAATLETPLSVQRLTDEEIRSNPGGNFDISRVIQSLPGVGGTNSTSGGVRNDIIIRGGAPNENVYYLDGIEIPVINHFQTQGSSGGPQGILNVSFIDDVKLSSSAFDARYDNALSSVFQFRQKNGNPYNLQGNVRLSATELAATLEGPLAKDKQTTFLASVRRSYLQLVFSLIDLPIRPNYWDFQTKITRQINKKTTLSFIGIGAIDQFSFVAPRNATADKIYAINANPIINQWNYTVGLNLKRLVRNGYVNIALSRNTFDNQIDKYEDNQHPEKEEQTLDFTSRETENKLRIDVNKNAGGWRWSYGVMSQLVGYSNNTYNIYRKEIKDSNGVVIQPAVIINYSSPLKNFVKLGGFVQVGRKILNEKLGISAGLRTDMNTFTTTGMNGLKTLSPRISFSYVLADKWTANASIGSYYKIPPYTILGFADNKGEYLNKDAEYQRCNHYVAGFEYLPGSDLRFTLEGFYKQYSHVPVSVRDGISLANLGGDFEVLGNEDITSNGKGKAYGIEFFAQQKLSKRFFGILSYTYFKSRYSGANGIYIPSSWDNNHLLTLTFGYKFNRNWELGLKFRYQGGTPYTPYDTLQSRVNFLSLGTGIFDYTHLNTLRVRSYNESDIRIDKKWNFKKLTLDFYIDVTNWYAAKNEYVPQYTFKRTEDNKDFLTTDGKSIQPDGSNAIPVYLKNEYAFVTPTIGFIVEF
jgi:hypothetical protein